MEQREIKFRAWDNANKRWYVTELEFKGFSLFGECMLVCPPRLKDLQNLQVTQFTGLLDNNGVEIYEGDIIQMTDDDKVSCVITWSDGSFHMITDSSSGRSPVTHQRTKRFKVVGNIFENPELLK